jgi:heat shock protein HslJ
MTSEPTSSDAIALNNSNWRLEKWEYQGTPVMLIPQTEVSLHFEDNQVNGFAGCNRFGGPINRMNDQFSLGPLRASQRGCDTAVMDQESRFLAALQSVYRATSDASGNLILSYKLNTTEGILYFVKTAL